jgi:hypothetical protein
MPGVSMQYRVKRRKARLRSTESASVIAFSDHIHNLEEFVSVEPVRSIYIMS